MGGTKDRKNREMEGGREDRRGKERERKEGKKMKEKGDL